MSAFPSTGRLTSVRPLWAIEGGRVTLEGDDFPVDPAPPQRPRRRAAGAARPRVAVVPDRHRARRARRRRDGGPDRRAARRDRVRRDRRAARDRLHQVDSPAFDRHGNLYVTFSGSRGQQAPVAIFIVRPDGTREPFVTRPGQSDVAGVRSRRTRCTCRAASTAASTASSRTAASSLVRDRSRRRLRHRVRPGRRAVRRRSIGIDSPRRRDGTRARRSRRSRRASPRFISRSVPTAALYVTAPTLGTHDACTACRPTARSTSAARRLRPSAGARVRSARRAVRRRRARRGERRLPASDSIAPDEPELVLSRRRR